jgi:hypothetical protein
VVEGWDEFREFLRAWCPACRYPAYHRDDCLDCHRACCRDCHYPACHRVGCLDCLRVCCRGFHRVLRGGFRAYPACCPECLLADCLVYRVCFLVCLLVDCLVYPVCFLVCRAGYRGCCRRGVCRGASQDDCRVG